MSSRDCRDVADLDNRSWIGGRNGWAGDPIRAFGHQADVAPGSSDGGHRPVWPCAALVDTMGPCDRSCRHRSVRIRADQCPSDSVRIDVHARRCSASSVVAELDAAGVTAAVVPGLYYLRARYYDAASGQFISRDPAFTKTRHAYAYTTDYPLNLTDPSGLFAWNDLVNGARTALHAALDIAAVAPYATYYGSHNLMKNVNDWGDQHGLAGKVFSRIVTTSLIASEAAGLAGMSSSTGLRGTP